MGLDQCGLILNGSEWVLTGESQSCDARLCCGFYLEVIAFTGITKLVKKTLQAEGGQQQKE